VVIPLGGLHHLHRVDPNATPQALTYCLLLLLLLSHSPYTDPYDGSTKQGPELTLVPEVGKPAKVVILNVYAGKVSPGRWPS
jgi:hypothetical protein